MDQNTLTPLIFSALLSIIVTLITFYITNVFYANRKARRLEKVRIFRTLMATRNLQDYEAVRELNSIHVVFSDSKAVLVATDTYLNSLRQEGAITSKVENDILDNRTKLFEAMSEELGYKNITWDIISKPYRPLWLAERQEGIANQDALMKSLISSTKGASKENVQ